MALTPDEAPAPTHIADKSASARLRHESVSAVFAPLIQAGTLATCSAVDLEVLFSARTMREFDEVRLERSAFPRLAIERVDFDRAVEVMGLLARRGQHRAAGLPDLLLAAVAERHGVTLLHYDADFDVIARVTRQPMKWVVPRGSVP